MIRRLLLALAALVLVSLPARATQGYYAQFTVAVTATALPGGMLTGSCSYLVTNGDAQPIYLGLDSSVTTSTGTPIAAGAWLAVNQLTYQGASDHKIYLISATGTSANAVKVIASC